DVEHRDVGHEAIRGRAMPVLLARLEEDTVAGPDHLDRPAPTLRVTDSFRDEDRLPVRMRVPGRARAGREVHAARAEPRRTRRHGDRIDEHLSREPFAGPPGGPDVGPGDLHTSSFTPMARTISVEEPLAMLERA